MLQKCAGKLTGSCLPPDSHDKLLWIVNFYFLLLKCKISAGGTTTNQNWPSLRLAYTGTRGAWPSHIKGQCQEIICTNSFKDPCKDCRAVELEPHSFSLLDPEKNWKITTEKIPVNLEQFHVFLLLNNHFSFFSATENSSKGNLVHIFTLDPDPH